MRKTKIICTIGPAVANEEKIEKLIRAGMNVARLNFSHGDHETHGKTFKLLDDVRTRMGAPLAILLDTRGPEVRTTQFEGGKAELLTGQTVRITGRDELGNASLVPITHKTLYKDVKEGGRILLDDGLIELTITEIKGEDIICTVINSGVIKDRKGVNIPGVDLSMPYLSGKDVADIIFGARTGFDYIAASFVNSADDIAQIRRVLAETGRKDMGIIAKIESGRGVKNIDEIIAATDGIMVARGDLGVEIPMADVPVAQKQLVKKAMSAGKIVIIATQMLESMTHSPRPTRAEAADVANAIYDGATAVMLSGETAVGDYPIETVTAMSQIAKRVEQDIDYPKRMSLMTRHFQRNRTTAIAHATCSTAHDLDAEAIVTVTHSGQTAWVISNFHPGKPILGCTPKVETYRRMSLMWGVQPVLVAREEDTTDKLFRSAIDTLLEAGLLHQGDLVIITAGVPVGIPGTTNLLKAHVVGDPMMY